MSLLTKYLFLFLWLLNHQRRFTQAEESSSPEEESCVVVVNDQEEPISSSSNNKNNNSKTGDDEKEEGFLPRREIVINDWGKPQVIELDDEIRDETLKVIQRTEGYMRQIVSVDQEYDSIRDVCKNNYALCSHWAVEGDCDDGEEREYMIENCSPACLTCDLLQDYLDAQEEEDEEEEEEEEGESESEDDDEYNYSEDDDEYDYSEDDDEEEEEPGEIVKSPWGVDQELGTKNPDKVRQIMKDTHKYMMEVVYQEKIYENIFDQCENKDVSCSLYASRGYCEEEEHEDFMTMNCAPACRTCDLIDFKNRCPVDHSKPMAWPNPGDLNAMFERITNDQYWNQYGPITVLSSPTSTDDGGGPWVVTLDNFVTDEECERLIEIGAAEGYIRSADVGEMNPDGTYEDDHNSGRTSTNAWCGEECNEDPILEPLHRRMDELAGMHYNHSEYLQLLKYEVGQFYNEHHDYIQYDKDRPIGPRIITIFLYLNDVEEGGGTRFGPLDITAMPKKGRALVWPSVLNEDPSEWDERTKHEALPVEKGRKYGANAWYHQRDFKTAFLDDCT